MSKFEKLVKKSRKVRKLNVAGSQQGQVSTASPFKNIIANTTGSKQVEKGKLK